MSNEATVSADTKLKRGGQFFAIMQRKTTEVSHETDPPIGPAHWQAGQ